MCGGCGEDLSSAQVVGTVVRQVLEIPRIEVRVTDHVAERRRCACGHETVGVFPPEARAPVCWGPEVRAFALYLMDRVRHEAPSTGWGERTHLGLSQQPVEAGSSLTPETRVRVEAAPTKPGRSGTARRAGPGELDGKVYVCRNQWWNPLK